MNEELELELAKRLMAVGFPHARSDFFENGMDAEGQKSWRRIGAEVLRQMRWTRRDDPDGPDLVGGRLTLAPPDWKP